MTRRALEGNLGYKGERGYSAYEIAVQEGYEGTEEEWINHFGLDLSGYVQTDDVVDDLTHEYTTRPLSAKQGKELKSQIDTLDNAVDTLDNAVSVINQKAVVKGDFGYVSGTATWNQVSTGKYFNIQLDYPQNFNNTNCMLISAMCWNNIIPSADIDDGFYIQGNYYVILGDKIYIHGIVRNDASETAYIRILLYKIDEEV